MRTKYTNNLVKKLKEKSGLPFQDLLPENLIKDYLSKVNKVFRDRIYNIWIIIWAFLGQVMDEDSSCQKAVSRIIAFCSANDLDIPSSDNSAYCQARKRLPCFILRLLYKFVGKSSNHSEKAPFLWCDREVFVGDGSTLSMPDTIENQKRYPQPSSQEVGCGFPQARIFVLFALCSGAVLDAAMGPLKEGEHTLFRRKMRSLPSGSIFLGDRGFGSYANICLLKKKNVDSVCRLHAGRAKVNFKEGKRLGKEDHIVEWKKFRSCSRGFPPHLFHTLPEKIEIRILAFSFHIPGFRTKKIYISTTLLDAKKYPKGKIAEIYRLRWMAEISFRDLKTTMGMEIFRTKTPEMVRKEFYTYLLAYNLIRSLIWKTALERGINPLKFSYKGVMQLVVSFLLAMSYITQNRYEKMKLDLEFIIGTMILKNKLNRFEPRKKKRRPKSYGWLQKPRQFYKVDRKVA